MAHNPIPQLQTLDLTELTDYAVQLRYDIEFWPEKFTAETATHLAQQAMDLARKIVLT